MLAGFVYPLHIEYDYLMESIAMSRSQYIDKKTKTRHKELFGTLYTSNPSIQHTTMLECGYANWVSMPNSVKGLAMANGLISSMRTVLTNNKKLDEDEAEKARRKAESNKKKPGRQK